ncbi:MAG: hypothetical protein ACLP1D_14500, partial [Xanthobacteraceae bacterium]
MELSFARIEPVLYRFFLTVRPKSSGVWIVKRRRGRIHFKILCLGGAIGLSLDAASQSFSQTVRESGSMPASEAISIPLSGVVRAAWDSGLYQQPSSGGKIFWLDDQTIVVRASKERKPQNEAEVKAQLDVLYVWRLGEDPKPYGDDPHAVSR